MLGDPGGAATAAVVDDVTDVVDVDDVANDNDGITVAIDEEDLDGEAGAGAYAGGLPGAARGEMTLRMGSMFRSPVSSHGRYHRLLPIW